MEIGRLNQRVDLHQPTATKDAMGECVETFSKVASVWAEVAPITGRELEAAQASHSEVDLKVIIRYYSGLTTRWRVIHGTKTYSIVAALNLQAGNKALKLLCKELPATAV